jgi:HSP20 family protein
MNTLDRDFDTFFTTIFGDSPNRLIRNSTVSTVPRANITKTDESYLITLAAPGLSREDFNINVENNTLSISSEHADERVSKDSNYTAREFSYGAFTRAWSLPEGVNSSAITARYEAGLLKVDVPTEGKTAQKVVIDVD